MQYAVALEAITGKFVRIRGTERAMRIVLIAVLVWLVAWPAQAQMGGGRRSRGGDQRSSELKKPQIDEGAYKAALERIPEPKEKYDPWSGARPSQPDKKQK